MARITFITAFLVLMASDVTGQQVITLNPSSCDCIGRIKLEHTTVEALNTPPGPGKLEIAAGKGSPYYFEVEHNSVWYEFEAIRTAWLEFTVTPNNRNDDYDFLLFEFFGNSSCDSIAAGTLLPLRSVISRNDTSMSSLTGLHDTAIDTHIPQGVGPSFAAPVKVLKGQRYLLVLDNVYPNGAGHRIDFRYSAGGEEIETESAPFTRLSVEILDSLDRAMQARIEVKLRYPKGSEKALLLDTLASSARLSLNPGTFYVLSVRRDGYLVHNENFRTRDVHDQLTRKVKLQALVVGKSFQFENVYFRGGSDQFMPGAQDALKQIFQMLKDNPTICVEIQGHVNQPYNLISRMGAGESKQLSELRAKAVYDYLIRKGIDPVRVSYRGYGNSRMLYPYAKSEDEMKMNRRVEVVITQLLPPKSP